VGAAWHAPARAVFFALRAGRPVILAPDGRWPAPADALCAALADLPEGVFSVLHDDGRTLARAAASARDVPTAVAGDDRVDTDHEDAPHLTIARARRASVVVDPTRDLATQAERIVDAATGRARALSGSRAGQVGRVIAPERVFARAGELVLAALEKSADAAHPLPVAYAAQERVLEGALALGLDEGATAVLSGRDTGEPLFPLLFTNVEPAMRIARQDTPCGMLLLVRAHDLRAAHAIAARLDREVRS
jgi:acyl-CoA reductase-like NAD-dependent aldehyde dehydrogenase